MKKLLQIAVAITLTCTAIESKAQLASGSIAPDWTLTDINGVSHNLYTYLDSGLTVYIDVSATWCSPCWGFHQSGVWDSLWEEHGPIGGLGVSSTSTNDVMVFFIEGDGATNSADLHGTGSNTQGDWVTGVNLPIIDPASSTINTFNLNYQIGYFPTLYKICPDRTVEEVPTSLDGTTYISPAELYATRASCAVATVSVDAEMINSLSSNPGLASCDSVTPTFRLANVGTSPLTSATITLGVDGVTQKTINWTGNLATYESETFTNVKVGSTVSGTHTITAVISNPNGVSDPTVSNNSATASFVIYPTVGGSYVVESFETSGIPTSWTITSGGTTTWEDATAGFNSSNSTKLKFYDIPSGQIDIMTLPPMSFASATAASISFDVAYCGYTANSPESDKLEVQYSTNCGTSWTNVYSKAGNVLKTKATQTASFIPASSSEWRHESVNLPAAIGQSSILFRFKGTSDFGNNLYVDNINFSQSGVGIQENQMVNTINVYPNPMTNYAIVDFNLAEANKVSIVLVNTIGQVIFSEELGKLNAGTQNYSLDAASLSNGLYFLNIKIGSNTVTKKVAINK